VGRRTPGNRGRGCNPNLPLLKKILPLSYKGEKKESQREAKPLLYN